MGASTASVWYNLRVPHPTKEEPPQGLSIREPRCGRKRLFSRKNWPGNKRVMLILVENVRTAHTLWVLIDTEYEPLIPREEKSPMQIFCFNLRWKRILVLMVVWVSFLLLQVIKNDVKVCSVWYWVLFCLQFPIALVVFGYEAVKLYKDHKKRMGTGNPEFICEASIEWTVLNTTFCALCGILGGTVGGLLGSGGGFILGPLLIEIGVIPQVASATATFVMMFSSSLSVVEFYLLKRFPIPYALYLFTVSVLAGFWGQFFVRKLMKFLGRASIIVFILSGVILLALSHG
ncbi:Transmembrane protein [Sesbania bispinosa]|nr:Transmembrane protein [Sesbania bispinosa]